jgi:hypothetical protein
MLIDRAIDSTPANRSSIAIAHLLSTIKGAGHFPGFLRPADTPRNLTVMRQGQGAFEVLQSMVISPSGMIYRKVIIRSKWLVKKKILQYSEDNPSF